MDPLPTLPPDSYVSRAAKQSGISLVTASIEEKLPVFRVAMYNMEMAIREARADDMLAERFAKKDLRPDLKYILMELRRYRAGRSPTILPGGRSTVAKAMEYLEKAISHLNTAAQMHEVAHTTNEQTHWFGYQDSYYLCAESLLEVQEQLTSGGAATPPTA